MKFSKLEKLQKGDKVAIVSPSFAAPAVFPEVYELGLSRVRDVFGLEPIALPTTAKLGASGEERAADLVDAFTDPDVKAVISTLGGDDQVTYIKKLPKGPFQDNPKPFFGFSDNTHFMNYLWHCGVPSFYGGALMTQFAMQGEMNDFTVEYLNHALFDQGEFELKQSEVYNDVGLNWGDPETLKQKRMFEKNEGWYWDGERDAEGVTWGGCVESIDEMLRNDIVIPTLDQFENIVLFAETSEEMPSAHYVRRVFRALGERGILGKVRAVLVGRPKAWEFNLNRNAEEKAEYRKEQRDIVLETIRTYNKDIPVIQNMDFGHTDPQVCLPYGGEVRIDTEKKKIFAKF